MRLLFYAQVEEVTSPNAPPGTLYVTKTTRGKPTGPKGHVIKFDIEIPENVIFPEVKATLVPLQTATDQVVKNLRAAADSLKRPPAALPKGNKKP